MQILFKNYTVNTNIQKSHLSLLISAVTQIASVTTAEMYLKMLVVSGILNGEFELGNETYRDTTNFYNFEK